MFDFDVGTGPTNPAPPANVAAPGPAKPLTAPPPSASPTAMRDDSRAAERSAADPGGAHP